LKKTLNQRIQYALALVFLASLAAIFTPVIVPGVLPVVSDAPLTHKGLYVIVVEDSQDRLKPDYKFTSAINAADWRKHVKALGGEWRVIEPDEPMDNVNQVWRDALSLPRESLPWLIVSDSERGGYQGTFSPEVGGLLKSIQAVTGGVK
jgi:hypothetical protein